MILEQLGHLHRTTAAAAGAKGRELPTPLRYRRPYEPPPAKPPPATREQIKQRMNLRRSSTDGNG